MATTSSALDGLLYVRNGYSTMRWNFPDAVGTLVSNPGGIGNAVELSYSFLSGSPSYFTAPSFLAFNAAQKQATREILAAISDIAHIRFTEVAGVGQLTFGQSSQSAGQAGYASLVSYGYSYSGSPSTIVSVTESDVGGDVWINRNASWVSSDWLRGGNGYATLLHEIGHALGMKHPFDLTALVDTLDNEAHTVMSYNQAPNSLLLSVSGNEWSYGWSTYNLRPSTLMPLDIQALQYLYGTNTTTRTGSDTYRWSTNAELLETIWDAGGTDTIDCSNQALTCVIDLRAGAYSSIALRQTAAEIRQGLDIPDWFAGSLPSGIYNGSNNLAIAYGVVIEKAVGGSGNDRLIGNDAANTLLGGGGRDSVAGGNGNDSLDGGSGFDTMVGGAGNDSYSLHDSGDVITEAAGAGTDVVLSYLASHLLGPNVENGRIMLASEANLTGNSLNNLLYAGTGNNVIDGGAGIDTVSYYYGASSSGGVQVSLASTVAQSTSASGSDMLLNVECLTGSVRNDTLIGNGLANTLEGGAGDDVLDGAGGTDSVSYRSASSAVTVSLALAGKQATAGAGGDTLSNFENLLGSAYADTLTGNGSGNLLDGGAGGDRMTGGVGNDIYVVDNAGDIVVELAGGGSDLIRASIGYSLVDTDGAGPNGGQVENLQLLGSANLSATGNSLNNVIYANGGANVIDGGVGVDMLSYVYATTSGTTGITLNLGTLNGAGQAVASGISGVDLVRNIENLAGSVYADTLGGNGGANLLRGGGGVDTLAGGSGRDVFDFDASGDSSGIGDLITDFVNTVDRIDMSTIDANSATASAVSNEAFVFIGAAAFSATNATAQLRFAYDTIGHVGTLYGSTDADNAAEFAIRLTGVAALNVTTDLIL